MLTTEQERLRQDKSILMAELIAAGARFRGNHCPCPYHDDAHPSAGVYQDEGVWRFKCHGCGISGDVFDIRAKNQGKMLVEVLGEARGESNEARLKIFPNIEAICATLPNCEAAYTYTNPETKQPDLVVFRFYKEGRKSFIQARPESGGFVLKAPSGLLPLYNRTRLKDAEEVLIVEGEKCVHALYEIGLVATTSPGGAGKAAHADWSPLKGKIAYLWADNDAPDSLGRVKGVEHMRDVEKILLPLGCDVRWIDLANLNLPPKGDVCDYLDRNGGTAADKLTAIQLVLEEAKGVGVTAGLEERLSDIVQGRWKNYPFPWSKLSYLSKALLPGTITVLPGDPGSAKSFLLLEAMWHWHLSGIKVALYELEEDRTYHLHRALAQIEGHANLVDDEWVRANAADTARAFMRNRDFLEDFGRVITDAPDEQKTLDELADWAEEKFAAGVEIVGIDPVTAALVSDKPWIDDQKFILRAKKIARKYNGRLLLVTHPRKNRGKAGGSAMSDMAGGAAYERFSQTVLWLKRHEQDKNSMVFSARGLLEHTFDRSIYIRKARNGSGTGAEIAFKFNSQTLRFDEVGLVQPQKARVGVV